MKRFEDELTKEYLRECSDTDELTAAFRSAVMLENFKKKILGVPVARYDTERRQVYLEYPDGRKEYKDAE